MLKIDIYWDLRATNPIRYTGVGKHVIEVVSYLATQVEFDVRILLAKDQRGLWEEQSRAYKWQGLRIQVLPFSNKFGRVISGLTSFWSLDAICSGRDVVYSPMEMLLVLKKIPFINTVHGIPCFEKALPKATYSSYLYRLERFKQRWFFRRCIQRCALSISVSNYLKLQLVNRFHFNPKKVKIVYNGADESFFAPEDCHDVGNNSSLRLLTVGGANAFDGGERLVELARFLAKEMPEVQIRIAGDRHEEPWLSQLRSLPNIVFLGFLQPDDLITEMACSSALLYLPTVESFGIIGVEAMAVGLPIFAQKSPPLMEVLDDAPCWIDVKDPEHFLQNFQKLLADDVLRTEYASKGRLIAERFRWRNVVQLVAESLNTVATHEKQPSA